MWGYLGKARRHRNGLVEKLTNCLDQGLQISASKGGSLPQDLPGTEDAQPQSTLQQHLVLVWAGDMEPLPCPGWTQASPATPDLGT